MKVLIFVLISILSIFAKEKSIDFSGELNTQMSMNVASVPLFINNTTFRLTGDYLYEKAELRASMLFTKSFAPLDPLFSLKSNSYISNMVNSYLMNLMSQLDSEQLSGLSKGSSLMSSDIVKYIPYSTLYSSDKFLLDKAYLKLRFSSFDFYIGKQVIAWGTGYAFNPTDVWNMKNPMDATAAKNGVNALRTELFIGNTSTLDFVFKSDLDPRHTSQGIRLKSTAKGFDYSFSAIRLNNSDYEIYGIPRKFISGFDFSGEIIGGIGINGEIAGVNPVYDGEEWSDFDSAYVQAVFGGNYITDNGTNITAEFYYNQLGKNDYKNYVVQDFINTMVGDESGMGMYYVFAGATRTFLYNWDLSCFTLINVADYSFMLMPQITYNYNDNIALSLFPNISLGDKRKSEFGSYSSSVNFKVDGFF